MFEFVKKDYILSIHSLPEGIPFFKTGTKSFVSKVKL